MRLQRGKLQILLLELVNVVCHVAEHFLSCDFDFLTNWLVDEYKILVATLMQIMTSKTYVKCPPRFLVDITMFYDVIFLIQEILFIGTPLGHRNLRPII